MKQNNSSIHYHSSMLTDLYELTMAQAYFSSSSKNKSIFLQEAVFDYFFRKMPFNGGFALFAGMETLLKHIENFAFYPDDIEYLKSLKLYTDDFLDYLSAFHFKGDIWAFSEGEIVFANEPIIRIHGNIIETMIIESVLLNIINFQTLIATKAMRMYIASKGARVMEFGLRRAQGPNGALMASRAAYIGGCSSTSNMEAGRIFSIPVAGTMAHSWIMFYGDDYKAFSQYVKSYPDNAVFLIDTFDSLNKGLRAAMKVIKEQNRKTASYGIRLDSGDLSALSKEARKILDGEGLEYVKIIVSNEIDEYIISQLIEEGAQIDGWGIGTKLVTADKDSSLSGVYKMVAKKTRASNGSFQIQPLIKLSSSLEKTTLPGIKNIYRLYNEQNEMISDLIFLQETTDKHIANIKDAESASDLTFCYHPVHLYHRENLPEYSVIKIMLHKIVEKGDTIKGQLPLSEIRENAIHNVSLLNESFKRLLNPHVYPVLLSRELADLKKNLIEYHGK